MLPLVIQDEDYMCETCSSGQRPLPPFLHTISDQTLHSRNKRKIKHCTQQNTAQ